MNKKSIQALYQDLPELVTKGIISPDSADKLRGYYGQVKTANKKLLTLILCSGLGAILIGLGIISLFAHNWDDLSREIRTLLSLAPLIAAILLAGWVIWKKNSSLPLKEASGTFLTLMIGASIALISQTYHIAANTADFTLTWMLLTLPLVYLMEATIPAVIFLIGITVWAGHYGDNPFQASLFWPLFAAVIPHFIHSAKNDNYAFRSYLASLTAFICVCVAAGFTMGKAWAGSWTIIYSCLFSVFYMLGNLKIRDINENWQRPFRGLGALSVIVFSFILSYSQIWDEVIGHSEGIKSADFTALPDHLLTIGLIILTIHLFYTSVKNKNEEKTLFAALPLLAVLSFALCRSSVILSAFLFSAYLLILSLIIIKNGLRINYLPKVNMGMLILSALIILRFFDSEINFVLKGIAFILIGTGFLTVNLTLMRRGKGGQA